MLRIKPYKVWKALTQNFLHLGNIWEACLTKSNESLVIDIQTLSVILGRYIVTEVMVKCHKSVYVSD